MENKRAKGWIKYLVIPEGILYDPLLTSGEKLFLSLLRVLEGKNGCYYSYTEYFNIWASMTNITNKTSIVKIISSLKEKKYITIKQSGTKGMLKCLITINREKTNFEDLNAFNDTSEEHSPPSEEYSPASSVSCENNLNFRKTERCLKSKEVIVPLEQSSFPYGKESYSKRNLASQGDAVINKKQKTKTSVVIRRTPKLVVTKNGCPSEKVKSLLSYWKELALHKYRNEDNGAYSKAVLFIKQLLQGIAFETTSNDRLKNYQSRKFTVDEIKLCFNRLKEASQTEYYSSNRRRYFTTISIDKFIYNPFSDTSLFVEFFENPPKKPRDMVSLIDDSNPILTNNIRKFYFGKTAAGKERELANLDENSFRACVARCESGYDELKPKLHGVFSAEQLLDLVKEAVWEKCGESARKLKPYMFSTDLFWNEFFPSWLIDQGVMDEE